MTNWFSFPGQPGDRTFEQQMTGLDPWLAELCHGKSILDFGCAEGLISIHLLKNGAAEAMGVELVPGRVASANKAAYKHSVKARFLVADANLLVPAMLGFDVTLALAILHKLRDPSTVARRLARATREHLVMRLPPHMRGTVVDPRSKNVPHDLDAVLRSEGFVQERAGNDGPLGEWIAAYRRVT